jgi:hypothetical protein
MKLIDNNHFRISDKLAGQLARENPCFGNTKLPKHGYERCVIYQGKKHWMFRTNYSSLKRGWTWCLYPLEF